MEDIAIKEGLKFLAEKYPLVREVSMFYYGSGDSFDSYDLTFEPKKPAERVLIEMHSEDFEDIFNEMLERAGSDFNNDGSEGNVIFHLEEGTVEIDDYYMIRERAPNINITI